MKSKINNILEEYRNTSVKHKFNDINTETKFILTRLSKKYNISQRDIQIVFTCYCNYLRHCIRVFSLPDISIQPNQAKEFLSRTTNGVMLPGFGRIIMDTNLFKRQLYILQNTKKKHDTYIRQNSTDVH